MPEWFTVGRIDAQTYVISEPRHWSSRTAYLLEGSERSLLIDTGLGICDISVPVSALTHKRVTAALTHAHWDHIGGLWHYGGFCAHAAELSWLTGGFPLPAAAVREMLARGGVLPEGFDTAKYELFQGAPMRPLGDGDVIDLGGRRIERCTPPATRPGTCATTSASAAISSPATSYTKARCTHPIPPPTPKPVSPRWKKPAALPVGHVFPGHHSLDIRPGLHSRNTRRPPPARRRWRSAPRLRQA